MKNILLIGSGRCAYPIIDYILNLSTDNGWFLTVGDAFPEKAQEKVDDRPNGRAVWLDATKVNDRREMITRADVVISLLPAHLHLEVAHDCIKLKKPLITSSYISHEIYRLGDEARDRELLFTEENALAPGIDELQARWNVHDLQKAGAKIKAFRSFSGGLMANMNSTNNPWQYKFTWNPRNVVLAGQGTAQYLEDAKLRYLPYNRLFQQPLQVDVPGVGKLEAYLNRDSLLYAEEYGLGKIPNLVKGTLRPVGFCAAWDALIQLGLTDGDFPILHADKISYYNLIDGMVGEQPGTTLKERTAHLLGVPTEDPLIQKLQWLGLFSKRRINLPNATPALILEHLLREKWKLEDKDEDQVIIHQEIYYELNRKNFTRKSTMILKGSAPWNTAMAKNVSLPMAIVLKILLLSAENELGAKSLRQPEVYQLIIDELKELGIHFEQQDTAI